MNRSDSLKKKKHESERGAEKIGGRGQAGEAARFAISPPPVPTVLPTNIAQVRMSSDGRRKGKFINKLNSAKTKMKKMSTKRSLSQGVFFFPLMSR